MYSFTGSIDVKKKHSKEVLFEYKANKKEDKIEVEIKSNQEKITIDEDFVYFHEQMDFNQEIITSGRIFITYYNPTYQKNAVATVDMVLDYDYDNKKYKTSLIVTNQSKLFKCLKNSNILDKNCNIKELPTPPKQILNTVEEINVFTKRIVFYEEKNEENIITAMFEEINDNVIIYIKNTSENILIKGKDIITDPQINQRIHKEIISNMIESYKKTLSSHDTIDKILQMNNENIQNIQKTSETIAQKAKIIVPYLLD